MKSSSFIKVLYCSCLLCSTLVLNAQNWECIKTEGEYIYGVKDTDKITLNEYIRIDSVSLLGPLKYYFTKHKKISWIENVDCYNPFSFSFIGKLVFSDTAKSYHFIDHNNDTIHIKSNTGPNEYWVFYENEIKNLILEAYVDTIELQSFSGVEDSVKVIKFIAKNFVGQVIQHPVTSSYIVLSKNYGLSKMFDLINFPEWYNSYLLMGMNHLNKGYTNFGLKEIWDMEVGDEFHELKQSTDHTSEESTYTIKTLLSKSGNTDSLLNLTFAVSKHHYDYVVDTIYPPYTTTETIDFNDPELNIWNIMPGESNVEGPHAEYYTVNSSIDSSYQKKNLEYPQYYRSSDSCYQYDVNYLHEFNYYIKGAGGRFYTAFDNYYYSTEKSLKYYKKGDKVWGNPFDYAKVKGWWPFNNMLAFVYGKKSNTPYTFGEYQIQLSEVSNSTGIHYKPEYYNLSKSENCWYENKIGIFGADIITDYKGNYSILTKEGDTLLFKIFNPIGEEWTFYKNETNNLIIKARNFSQSSKMIIDKIDSVKVIKFQAYNLNGNPLDHPVNSQELELSKTHGFINIFDLYYFPDSINVNYELKGYYPRYTPYYSTQIKGLGNITIYEIYDITVGDRIDLVNYKTFTGGESVTKKIRFLLSKDSDIYFIKLKFRELIQTTTNYESGEVTITNTQDTITQEIFRYDSISTELNKHPGQLARINGENRIAGLKYTPDKSVYDGNTIKFFAPFIYSQTLNDSCLTKEAVDCEYFYVEKLGGPYEKCIGTDYSSIDEIVFFQSGSQSWGTAHNPSDILGDDDIILSKSGISYYPNPADKMIIFSLDALLKTSVNMQIFNSVGLEVMNVQLTGKKNYLNVEKLSTGIYYYRIESNSLKSSGKFVIID